MLYEIRRYQTRPGRRAEWVEYMDSVVVPYFTDRGMDIVGLFVDEADPDGYVWIRRFEDEDDRTARCADVYESERWVNEIGPVVHELLEIDQSVITSVVPTSASALQ
jgi:hypothetical protein